MGWREEDGQSIWSPTKEIRVFGPPGTGKTTYLARQIALAAEKHGTDNIIVASFTRTAAYELNSRQLPIPKTSIGTLHALCYQNFRQYEIAELHAAEFNQEYPHYAISGEAANSTEDNLAEASFKTEGDRMLNAYNLQRARIMDINALTTEVKGFVKAWESWKTRSDFIDFTDMIGITIQLKYPPPNGAEIGFFDECQDFNKMQMQLVRSWGEKMRFFILGLDDDQAIFSFTGADPMAVLEEDLPEDHKRVLSQSYRVPRSVQEYAERWIKNVSFRQEKIYRARDEEGEVRRVGYNYRQSMYLLDEIQPYLDKGKTVMFLATCGYMLDPLKRALRENGVPFHNPYRPTRGDWNPLGSFRGGGTHRKNTRIASRERLLAYLSSQEEGKDLWSLRNLSLWMDMVKSKGIFKPKAKERVDGILETLLERPDMPIDDFYEQIFIKDALQAALTRDPEWLKHQLLASKIATMEYPFTVLKKKGKEALEKRPQVLLGTIHSVKGGEADVVVLFPDVSMAGYREWTQGGMGKDSVIRTLYVGMTRCRESLLVAEPASQLSIQI